MDLQSGLICVLVFVISAVILLLISMFGMKEKSYEEALAEQRKLTSGLLGTGQRPKPKEKKQKKAVKKMKEKAAANSPTDITGVSENLEESDNTVEPSAESAKLIVPAVESTVSNNSHIHHNLHVEFEEPPVIEQPQQTNRKRSKKEKVRSILLNKEKSPVRNANSKEPPLNHFEKIHPKDEFELLYLHKKSEPETKEKTKSAKNKQQNVDIEHQKNKNKIVEPQSEQQKGKNKTTVESESQKIKNKSSVLEPETQKLKNKTIVDVESQKVKSKTPLVETDLQKLKNKPVGEQEMQKGKNKSTPIEPEQQKVKNKGNTGDPEQQKVKNKSTVVDIEPKVKNKTNVVENELQKAKTKPTVIESEQQKTKSKMAIVDLETQKSKSKHVAVEPEVQKIEKKASKTQKQLLIEKADEVRPVETVAVVKPAPIIQQSSVNSAKDKKKKKSEFNTLQQMTSGERPGVNVSLLVPLVRKADLSRSEIQILIDLLLNKQHEAPDILDEWSEGRADPVQKLKKQLAEKERALTEEQEAMVGVQAKLREVRAELNSERSRLLQNCRNLEETLHAKHTEMQQMMNRHHTQNQKLQQMQAQLNEEIMTSRKLREEHNALQMQRQQLEMHLQTINEQQQEAEGSFQSQLNQVRVELHEQQNLNSQLNMELHELREKIGETEMLHERIRQIENQAIRYKNESDQKQELARQLEESRRMYSELEHNFGVTHHSENELKMLCQQHLEEARRLEVVQNQSHDELSRLQSEITRLNAANKQQQEENDKFVAQLQSELATLKNEKSKLEAISEEAATNKVKEVEVLNLQNELASLKVQLQQKEIQFSNDLDLSQKSLKNVELELEEQRSKNNELRQKNWKVMDALSATEASLRNKSKDSVSINVDEIKKQIKLEEQENNRKFLERLFPDVKIPNSEQWMDSAEKTIKKFLSTLEMKTVPSSDNISEINKLQAQIANYKTIIDDTEGMLNKLQSHIEDEERNWRRELQTKEMEIESLKEQNSKQLKATVEDLQSKLELEQQSRQDLITEYEAFKCQAIPVTDSKHTQFGNLVEKEKLLEENSRLAEELSKEQQRYQKLNEELLHRQVINADTLLAKSTQNHASNGTSSLDIIDSESASNN